MATRIEVLSQEPASLNLAWRVGDAVNMGFTVVDVDWSGTYTAQIRRKATDTDVLATLGVTATYTPLPGSGDTDFVLTLSAADSRTLGVGKFVWDLQDTGIDLTRLTGEVVVSQDVTRY